MTDAINFPLISVLLPVRNGAETLRIALYSLICQRFSNFEVLVLDDGSSDASVDIAKSIGDARIRVVSNGINAGLTARLNEGIDLARGQYIARMDADDVSFPDRLQLQYDYLSIHPEVDLLGTRAVVFRSISDIVGLLPYRATHEEICAVPWRGLSLPHPSWMGKASWFRKHRYRVPEVLRAEDQELLLRAAPVSRYACIDHVLLGYRQGIFPLQKVLLARRQLLRAQIGLFYQRRQWRYLSLAIAACLAKVAVDCLAALPGCSQLFFSRMGGEVSDNVIETLRATLSLSD